MNVPSTPNLAPELLRDMVNKASPGPNYITHAVQPPTGLNIPAWERYRHIFEHSDYSLLDQLKWGFPTGVPSGAILSVPFTNHSSARKHPDIVESYINKHLHTKALYGPYSANPLDVDIIVSPLQVAFSSSGKPRVCNDLSFGDCSVNNAISADWSQYPGFAGEFSLPTADDLVDAILQVGPGALLWKTDFAAYYKQLCSDPAQVATLAFAFDDHIYFESRLPFGLRSSCLNAQRVTRAVILIYNTKTKSFAVGYVDDVIGCSPAISAFMDYDSFCALSDELGLGRTLDKCVAPTYRVVWIGLQFDTIAMEISLPPEKRDRIIAALQAWLLKPSGSKTALQSLLGTLNHAASVVVIGRAFTGRILDIINQDSFPVPLDSDFKKDIEFWLSFLQDSKLCRAAFKSRHTIPCDSFVQIAVLGPKFAIAHDNKVGFFEVGDDFECNHPLVFVYAVWMASMMLASVATGKWITFLVPTQIDVHTINRARPVSPRLRPMVRQTWWVQATHDFVLRAKKGLCDREIDQMLNDCPDCTSVSLKTVPEYFC